MPELGYCKPCRDKGHNCETRLKNVDDEFICIFCADGVDCPIAEMKNRRICAAEGCRLPLIKENKTSFCGHHLAQAEKRRGAEKRKTPAPIVTTGEKTMEGIICKCGCGKNLRRDNKTGYFTGHKPTDGVGKGNGHKAATAEAVPPRKTIAKPKTKVQPSAARAAAAGSNGNAVATICVPEAALDRFWAGLSVEEKAAAFTEYLGRE